MAVNGVAIGLNFRKGKPQPCKESLDFEQGVYNFDTGTVSNKVSGGTAATVLDIPVFTTNRGGESLILRPRMTGGKSFYAKYVFTIDDLTGISTIHDAGADTTTLPGIQIEYNGVNGYLYVKTADATTAPKAVSGNTAGILSTINTLEVNFTGLTGGLITAILNGTQIISSTNTSGWTGTQSLQSYFGRDYTGNNQLKGKFISIELRCGYIDGLWCMHEGYGKTIYPADSQTNYPMEVITPLGFNVWQNKLNGIVPYLHSKYYTTSVNNISANVVNNLKTSDFDILFHQLQYAGAAQVTVNQDGTKDYTSIRAALRANTTRTHFNRLIINIDRGTYYEQDLIGSEWVWLRPSVGDEGLVIIDSDGLSTAISPADYIFPTYANTAYNLIPSVWKHQFYLSHNMLITDIISVVNDVKYNIHADNTGSFNCYIHNCNFTTTDGGYNLGFGIRNNQIYQFNNCQFNTDTADVNSARINWHHTSSNGISVKTIFENCSCNNDNFITLAQLDSITETHDLVILKNCTAPAGKGVLFFASAENVDYTYNCVCVPALPVSQTNRPNYLSYYHTEYFGVLLNRFYDYEFPSIGVVDMENIEADPDWNETLKATIVKSDGLIISVSDLKTGSFLKFQLNAIDYDLGIATNKIIGEDSALLVNSNSIYFDGTAYAEKVFTSDILQGANISIEYSLNGTTKLLWETGDAAVSGLLEIDLTNRKLTVGKNGVTYFTGWISRILINNKIEWTLTSSSIIQEYNRLTNINSVLINKLSDIGSTGNQYGFEVDNSMNIIESNVDILHCYFGGQSNASGGNVTLAEIDTDLLPFMPYVFIKQHLDSFTVISDRIAHQYYPVSKAVAFFSLKLAQLTGKYVYITIRSVGGTSYYTNPSWKVSDAEYALEAYNDIIASNAYLNGSSQTYYPFAMIWNLAETTSLSGAETATFSQDEFDLMSSLKTAMGGNPIILKYLLSWKSSFVTTAAYFGKVTNAIKESSAYDKTYAHYIAPSIVQNVDDYALFTDLVHYAPENYAPIYKESAQILANRYYSALRIRIVSPSIKLTNTLKLQISQYPVGAKSVWMRFNLNSTTGAIRYMFNNFDATNGMRITYPANASYPAFYLYRGGANICAISGSSNGGYGTILVLATWDGLIGTNNAKLYSKNILYSKPLIKCIAQGNVTNTELASTLPPNIQYTSESILSIGMVNRVITASEMILLETGYDNDISGATIYNCNEGYGLPLYSNTGVRASDDQYVTRIADSIVPIVNLSSSFKLQTDNTNFRAVSQTLADGGGWTIIENINPLYFYYILGGKLKFPQIPELVVIDTANVLYDATTGLAKEVTGAALISANNNGYLTVVYDTYKITAINIADVNILNYTNVSSEQKNFPTALNMQNGFTTRGTLKIQHDQNGVCVLPSEVGDVEHVGSALFHNGAETDLNVDSTVINMDEIGQDVGFGSNIFANVTKADGVITKVKDLAVYSTTPTGNCFNKTVRWAKMLPYALQDVNNEYILDTNGEYQITAE